MTCGSKMQSELDMLLKRREGEAGSRLVYNDMRDGVLAFEDEDEAQRCALCLGLLNFRNLIDIHFFSYRHNFYLIDFSSYSEEIFSSRCLHLIDYSSHMDFFHLTDMFFYGHFVFHFLFSIFQFV